MPTLLYTSANCPAPAYQLNWSYSLFWKSPPLDDSWMEELTELNAKDDIRLLRHEFKPPTTSQFLISTQPHLAPATVVHRVKGRLQHLVRALWPKAFRRNYSLRSIGSTRRNRVETYLQRQLDHHRSADPGVHARMARHQISNAGVDLSLPRQSAHARHWYNLHIVLVHESRFREIRDDILGSMRRMVVRASAAKGHRLSHAAILPDHVHLTLGCNLDEAPEEVALSYMNNLAYACGMRPVFSYGYYVGTFGEYDLGVVPRESRSSAEPCAPPG